MNLTQEQVVELGKKRQAVIDAAKAAINNLDSVNNWELFCKLEDDLENAVKALEEEERKAGV